MKPSNNTFFWCFTIAQFHNINKKALTSFKAGDSWKEVSLCCKVVCDKNHTWVFALEVFPWLWFAFGQSIIIRPQDSSMLFLVLQPAQRWFADETITSATLCVVQEHGQRTNNVDKQIWAQLFQFVPTQSNFFQGIQVIKRPFVNGRYFVGGKVEMFEEKEACKHPHFDSGETVVMKIKLGKFFHGSKGLGFNYWNLVFPQPKEFKGFHPNKSCFVYGCKQVLFQLQSSAFW